MESPAVTDDHIEPAENAAPGPATVVDLTAGPVHITPVVVGGEARYEVDLPDEPLAEEDVESLAVALHTAQSGAAVLVDVEEYREAVQLSAAGPEEAGEPGP